MGADAARVTFARPTLAILPRVSDGLALLFTDVCRVVQTDTGVCAEVETEAAEVHRAPIPTASLACAFRGPGASITSPAIATLMRHSTTVVSCGAGESLITGVSPRPTGPRLGWIEDEHPFGYHRPDVRAPVRGGGRRRHTDRTVALLGGETHESPLPAVSASAPSETVQAQLRSERLGRSEPSHQGAVRGQRRLVRGGAPGARPPRGGRQRSGSCPRGSSTRSCSMSLTCIRRRQLFRSFASCTRRKTRSGTRVSGCAAT